MMMKSFLKHMTVVAAIALMTFNLMQAHDRLFINPMEMTPGVAFQLPIYMSNDTAYCAFQTDLYLPDGMYVTYENNEYVIDLTSRATSTHTVVSYRTYNDDIGLYVYRIMVTSQDNHAFNGNTGIVANVMIGTYDYFTGGEARLLGSRCVEANGTKHRMDDCTAALTVLGQSIAGDANGDGQVDISDVNATINMMLGKASPTPSADVNCDGIVDISDINAVINAMLGKD